MVRHEIYSHNDKHYLFAIQRDRVTVYPANRYGEATTCTALYLTLRSKDVDKIVKDFSKEFCNNEPMNKLGD